MYPAPTHRSRSRKGTIPNTAKKQPIAGSGRNRPAKGYNQVTKTWEQDK
jgi:hypothetical protein